MSEQAPSAVVVDDSTFMRTVIEEMLEEGGFNVLATAENGREAVRVVRDVEPDVVTMDIEMPVMDGVEAVEAIMADNPTPILMLSAHAGEKADVTFEALDRGAVDFFMKPGGDVSIFKSRFPDELVEKVRAVAGSNVSQTTEVDGASRTETTVAPPQNQGATAVIGASTGGPRVVERILSDLPLAANLRIIVVQHMPSEFTPRYAERLDGSSAYAVREAVDGDSLGGGEVVVAPGDRHLIVEGETDDEIHIGLDKDRHEADLKPAVDVTLSSAAETIDGPLVAAILTGMGADGADGVKKVAASGGDVLAQDEASSSVFGMPKRAIETGCVDRVLPASELGQGIATRVAEEQLP